MVLTDREVSHNQRLQINPEGVLHQEAEDIAEELGIMSRIFQEQWQVAKDFARHLKSAGNGRNGGQGAMMDTRMAHDTSELQTNNVENNSTLPKFENGLCDGAKGEAAILSERIESRRAEIKDLAGSIERASQRIQELLTLKQQQASIVEAKAALRRSDESIEEGRSIVAFTVVTIFFLPLGFFATFFGMNNIETNQSMWMSLNEQITWMFGLSTIVIAITTSIASSVWARSPTRLALLVPPSGLARVYGRLRAVDVEPSLSPERPKEAEQAS